MREMEAEIEDLRSKLSKERRNNEEYIFRNNELEREKAQWRDRHEELKHEKGKSENHLKGQVGVIDR